jgi:Cdc6-like AAA superfamily ATPase
LPDETFAKAFSGGRYRQNRGFVAQIGAQILNPKTQVFELLDNQRKAFALCRSVVEDAFHSSLSLAPPKKVIIIKGPPGSGKSVIAARLWASLVTDDNLPDGDVVFTTTSLSQNSNWSDLFRRATGVEAANGVVRKATSYSPITGK